MKKPMYNLPNINEQTSHKTFPTCATPFLTRFCSSYIPEFELLLVKRATQSSRQRI